MISAGGDVPVGVDGDGLMEVIGWQTQPGYAIHLLSHNGPNAFRGHMRKLVPLRLQVVRVTLPSDPAQRQADTRRAPVARWRDGSLQAEWSDDRGVGAGR